MCGVCAVGGGGGVTSPPRERKHIQTDLFVDSEFLVDLCCCFLGAEGVGGYDFFEGLGEEGKGGNSKGKRICAGH